MTLVSELHRVVLKPGSGQDSPILQDYAEFWKIPYTLNLIEPKGSIVFTSDRATAAQSSVHTPVILTLVGREEAERAASDAGVVVTSEDKLIRLPGRKVITVSMTADFHEHSGRRID